MKPMKDLFLLPVDGLGYEGYQLLIDHEFGHVSTNQAAAHAAHAVNHVDALADALQALFDDYKGLADSGDAGNWRVEDKSVGAAALKALADYRGEA